jgi:nucleotide-binding universal stress UspA family protein
VTTDTLTAQDELADRIPRSQWPPADEPAAETPRPARAATVQVIVAFDGSPAGKNALALGARLAGSAGSGLIVACVFPPESLAGISFDPRATRIANGDHRIFVRQDAEAVLGEARATLPTGLAVKFRALECESAQQGLRQLALSEAADLLVLGSTRRGPLGRLLHRSLARRVLRDAPTAVTVVSRDPRDRPRSAPGQPEQSAAGRPSDSGTLGRCVRNLRKRGI